MPGNYTIVHTRFVAFFLFSVSCRWKFLPGPARMGECGRPPPPARVPPTQFSTVANSARDLIYRGFVGGQMLSRGFVGSQMLSVACPGPCGTKLTSSATIAHALPIGSMSASLTEGRRKHDLTFSTLNNQVYTQFS